MIRFQTINGIRTKSACAYLALLNWYVDEVIETRNDLQKDNPVYVADDPEQFLVQVIGMIERQFGKTPTLPIDGDYENKYQSLLCFLRKYGNICRLSIKPEHN